MSATISITTNAGAIAVNYERASGIMARTVLKAVRLAEREVIRRLKESIRLTMNRRTGLMARRVSGRLTLTGTANGDNTLESHIRSRAWYAHAQETGATQTPKRSGHLAIPLLSLKESRAFGEGKDAANRVKARDVIDNPGRFGLSGTFTRGDIIFGRLLDHDHIVPMFVLRRSVTLRARRPHAITRELVAPRVRELLGDAVTEATQAIAAGREVPA